MNVRRGKRALSRWLRRCPSGEALARRSQTDGQCDRFATASQKRLEIISQYGHILERCSSSIERESDLPYPKTVIAQAIYEELMENPDSELREHLEIAFVQLESFVSADEYQVVQEFKAASRLAQEMAQSGDPSDIISSARILKRARGDRAVVIQERVSEKMRKRLAQIRSIGMPMLMARVCTSARES